MAERATGRARSAGFTLLEMLIALAILGLVIAVLTSGMRFAGRAWQSQESQLDREDDLVAVQAVLRSLIASGTAFQGGEGSLAFVGTMPRALQRPGLYDIELTTSGDRLILEWRPHLSGASAKPMSETELARGVAGLDLSYFVADGSHPPGAWSASLKDPKHPPSLVRLDLELAAGDRRRWPPLVIAPMIEGRQAG